MTITLPPDLERSLGEEARKCGTTLEQFVVSELRERYARPTETRANGSSDPGAAGGGGETLLDFLEGYVGVVEGPADLSKDTGKQFTDIVVEKHERIPRKRSGQ